MINYDKKGFLSTYSFLSTSHIKVCRNHIISKDIEKGIKKLPLELMCAFMFTHRYTDINKPCWQKSGVMMLWMW